MANTINGGRVNYTIGFNIDDNSLGKASSSIKQLLNTLNKIQNAGPASLIKINPEDNDQIKNALKQRIADAKSASETVSKIIQKSYNPKLGTLNITKFNEEMKKSGETAQSLQSKLTSVGPLGQQAFRQLVSSISQVEVKVKKTNKFLAEMGQTMINTIRWSVTSSAWNNMVGSVEKAWGFAKKLDSSLNDIRIVTGKSAEEMDKFAVSANKAAQKLGTSTTDYTNAALIYYQQGLSDAEVQTRTDITMKAANVTGQSTAEVSEQLTAVWNGYKVTSREAEQYIDKIAAVAATTAADLEELSTGMSKVASAANLMGVDIDQLNAQLATVISVTRQAPESVGTAFKTIFARTGDIEAGLDTETTLGKYTADMAALGFNVLDSNNKLRNQGEVIEEIGNKWSYLTREQQISLAQTMAGTRQYNNLLALFDNWDKYTDALETSRAATGTLQEQQDTYMESVEAHLEKLSAAGEKIYNALFDAKSITPLIDALSGAISLVGSFVDGIGGLGPILLNLGSIGVRVFSKQIGSGIANSIVNFKESTKQAEDLKNQYELLDKFSKGSAQEINKNQTEIGRTIVKLANKGLISQERADELETYVDRLAKIGDTLDELTEKQKKYNDIEKEGFGEESKNGEPASGAAFLGLTEDVKNIKVNDKESLESNQEYQNVIKKIEERQRDVDIIKNVIEEDKDDRKTLEYFFEEKTETITRGIRKIADDRMDAIDEAIERFNNYNNIIGKTLSDEEKGKLEGAINKYKDLQAQYKDKEGKGRTKFNLKELTKAADEVKKIYAEIFNSIEEGTQNFIETNEGALEAVAQLAEQRATGVKEKNEKDIKNVQELEGKEMQDFQGEISNENLKEKISLITDLAGSVGNLVSGFVNISNIVQILNDEDLTFFEKLERIIPIIIATLPMFISGIQGMKASLIGLGIGGAGAGAGLTVAGAGGVAAGAGFNIAAKGVQALIASLGLVGLIITGITIALTALVALATWVFEEQEKAWNSSKRAAEEAAEAYEKAKNAAAAAKSEFEDFQKTISSYETAIEGLDKLVKGTDEYRDAIREANEQAKALIESQQDLEGQYHYNTEGLIEFNENALETSEILKEQALSQAELQESLAGVENDRAQQKANASIINKAAIKEMYGILADIPSSKAVFTPYANSTLFLDTMEKILDEKGGVLTDEIIDSYAELISSNINLLVSTDSLKNAVNKNSTEIQNWYKQEKLLQQKEKNTFKEIVDLSLKASGDTSYSEQSTAQQQYIQSAVVKMYDTIDKFYSDFDLEGTQTQLKEDYTEEQLVQRFGNLFTLGQYTEEDGKYKFENSDLSYTIDEIIAQIAKNQISVDNMSKVAEEAIAQAEKISIENVKIFGEDSEILTKFLTDNILSLSDFSLDTYLKAVRISDEELDNILEKLNYNSEEERKELIRVFKEQLKDISVSALADAAQTKAKEYITTGNEVVDKLLSFKDLSDEDLKFLEILEDKYSELGRIWDRNSSEYLNTLKACLELEEDTTHNIDVLRSKWKDANKAISVYNKAIQDNQIAQQNFNKSDQEKYESYTDYISSMYGEAEDLSSYIYDPEINTTNRKQYLTSKKENINSISAFIQDIKNSDYLNAGQFTSISDYSNFLSDLKENNPLGYTDEEIDSLKNIFTEYEEIYEVNVALEGALNEELELIQDELDYYENLEKSVKNTTQITRDEAEAAYSAIENLFREEIEIKIADREDVLTNVDDVIDRVKQITTAVESIGDGFIVANDKAETLLKTFPELAHNAQVLADGTIQLDNEVAQNILDTAAQESDLSQSNTEQLLKNKITEAEAEITAANQRIATRKSEGLSEIKIQEEIDRLKQTGQDETAKQIEEAAIDEVTNSAKSAEAVIKNWGAKAKAAIEYGSIAAQAEDVPHIVDTSKLETLSSYVNDVVQSVAEDEKKDTTDTGEFVSKEDYYERVADILNSADEALVSTLETSIAEYTLALSNMRTSFEDLGNAARDAIDKLKDAIDIYHDVNVELNKVGIELNRIAEAESHLVGNDLIKAQEKKLKLIQKEVDLQNQKRQIQIEEAKALKGHLLADGVLFNEDNTVANYTEVMLKQIANVKKAQVSGNDDTIKAAEENYEEFKKNFERYETLVNSEMPDLLDTITDNLYKGISTQISAVDTKIQITLDTRQLKRDWQDFLKEMTISSTDFFEQATYLRGDTFSKLADINTNTQAFAKTTSEVEKGIALALGTANSKQISSKFYAKDEASGQWVFDEAAAQEELTNYMETLTDKSLEIKDNMTALGQSFLDVLTQANEKIQEALDSYEDINGALNHGIKLIQLFEGEDSYISQASYYKDIVDNTNNQLTLLKGNRERLEAEMTKYKTDLDIAEAELKSARESGNSFAIAAAQTQYDMLKQAYNTTYDAWQETTEKLYSTIEEQYENIKNQYLNDVNAILDSMTKSFTGGSTLSYISDEWELMNQNAERYLDTVNSTYEVQSLQNKYLESIDATDSLSAQRKLRAVMEDEISLLQEKDKLSQYDIDRANKKYELTLKQIALEEAQANKSSMRLRRDAQGNYSYQFVADDEAVDNARQELLDLQNELYNFDKERYQQTLDEALDAYKEYQQKMLEAAQINDPEERARQEQLITEQYQELITGILRDNEEVRLNLQSSAFDSLKGLYDTNEFNFEEMTNGMFGDFSKLTIEDMPEYMGIMVAGWNSSLQQMLDTMNNEENGFTIQIQRAFSELSEAANAFDLQMYTLKENTIINGGDIRADIDKTKEKIEDSQIPAEELLDTLSTEIEDQYGEVREGLDLLTNKYIELGNQIEATKKKADSLLISLRNINTSGRSGNPSVPNLDTVATTTSGSGNGGGGSGSSGGSEKEDPWIGKVIDWKEKIIPFKYYNNDGTKFYLSEEEIWGLDVVNAWRGGAATLNEAKKQNPVKWKIVEDAQKRNHNNQPGYWVENLKTGEGGYVEKKDISKFDTGGYTGSWGSDGRVAMLHEKELILNKEDTANILDAVAIVRNIGSLISSFNFSLSNLNANNLIPNMNNNTVDQNVHIEANFPNVTSSSEIEDALNNLVNVASQRAFNTKI